MNMKKRNKRNNNAGAVNIYGIYYQFLFSCMKALEFLEGNRKVIFEGKEDFDIIFENEEREFFQVKTTKELTSEDKYNIIRNFLLVKKKHQHAIFTLVYENKLQGKKGKDILTTFKKQELIKDKNIYLKTIDDLDEFLEEIKFYNEREYLNFGEKIENLLIEKFEILTDNLDLFVDALLHNVSLWSISGEEISIKEIHEVLENTKENISKGEENLAISQGWISGKISFNKNDTISEEAYYEGISARPEHIANGFSVYRKQKIKQVIDILQEYEITIIKASSGQGKSTLLWQISETLKENYIIWELKNLEHEKAVFHVFQYLKGQYKCGNKILLVIDGLGNNTKNYVELAKQLRNFNVKILITSRENDWRNYAGNLSEIKYKIFDLELEQEEAKEIFEKLENKGKIDKNIKKWKYAWDLIKDRKLLLEYTYLITKGEKIEERITEQILELRNSTEYNMKKELLRIICLSNILDVRLKINRLVDYFRSKVEMDMSDFFKELEREFYITFDKEIIEGLHPVRSEIMLMNLVDEYITGEEIFIKLLDIIENSEYELMSFYAPQYIESNNKKNFYRELMLKVNEEKAELVYRVLLNSYKGELELFYRNNKEDFDKLSENKGDFYVVVTQMVPWFKNDAITTIDEGRIKVGKKKLKELFSELLNKKFEIKNLDIQYIFKNLDIKNRDDIENLGIIQLIAYKFETSYICFDLKYLEIYLLHVNTEEEVNKSLNLFYSLYLKDKIKYEIEMNRIKELILEKLSEIFRISKYKISNNNLDIEYIINQNNVSDNNKNESTNRNMYLLNILYKIFPFYKKYSSKVLYPNWFPYSELIVQYSIKNIENSVFQNMDLTTINAMFLNYTKSKYQANSLVEWIEHNYEIRKKILETLKLMNKYFENKFEAKKITVVEKNIVKKGNDLLKTIDKEYSSPRDMSRITKEQLNSEKNEFEEKVLNSIGKYNDKFSWICNFLFKDENLLYVHMKDIVYGDFLNLMQKSYVDLSKDYDLNTSNLEYIENIEYKKFFEYLTYNIEEKNKKVLINSNIQITNWMEKRNEKKQNEYRKIIEGIENIIIFPDEDIKENAKGIVTIPLIISQENCEECPYLNEKINEDISNIKIVLFILNESKIIYGFSFFLREQYELDLNKIFPMQALEFKKYTNLFKNTYDIHENYNVDYGEKISFLMEIWVLHKIKNVKVKEDYLKVLEKYSSNIQELSEYRGLLYKNNIEEDYYQNEFLRLTERV